MSDWSTKILGNLVSIKHGYAFKGEFFKETPPGDILLTPGNFAIGGGFQFSKVKYYSGPRVPDYELKPNDLLVTMTDLSKAGDTLGFPALVPDDGLTYLHNQRLGLVEFLSDKIDHLFFYWLMKTREYRHEVLASHSGAVIKHTSPSRILAYEFALPPENERKKIQNCLQSLEDKIEVNRRMNEVLEGMARAVFVDWFVDFGPTRRKMAGEADPVKILGGTISPPAQAQKTAALFPARLGENGLPEGWEEVLLGDFAVIKQGKYRKNFSDIPTEKENVPLYGGNGVRGFVKEADNRLSVTYITCRGSGCGFVQRPKHASSFTNSLISLSASHSDRFSAYLYYASKRMRFSSVTTGSAQPQITIGNIRTLPIVCPRDDLMGAFSELLFPNFELQIILEEENQTLAEMRDLLLPKLMSGEIRLREGG